MEFLVSLVALVCVVAFVTSGKSHYIDQVMHYSDSMVDVYVWSRTGVSLTSEEVRVYKKASGQAQAIKGVSSVIFCFCLLYLFPSS